MASRGAKAQTWAVETPRGPAEVELTMPAGAPSALLALGHGAGGGVDAPDLRAVRAAALEGGGLAVARITQPYRVAGRRAPAPAAQLDQAWTATVEALRADRPALAGVPLIVGGRSSGARVACRTAAGLGAAGVVALAFPLHPPGRPERSRADELDGAVPTVVVNGDRDPFGVPPARPGVTVLVRPQEKHDLRRDPAAVAEAVLGFLREHGWTAAPARR
jgi:predicted alpha/beta-hydrolase family hydrolase